MEPKGHVVKILVKRLNLLFPVFTTILIAMCMAQLSILARAPKILIAPFPEEWGIKATLIDVLFFIGIAALGSTLFYLILKHGKASMLKLFTLPGGIVSLLFCEGFLERFPTVPSIFLLWIWMYFVATSILFVVVNFFSERTNNIIFLTYGSILGGFLGMGIPTVSMIFFLAALCIYDVLSVRWRIRKSIVFSNEKRKLHAKTTYSTKEWEIGLGDLLFYSMLTSYSFINFGALTATFSAILILVGSILTMALLRKSGTLPGLPIPIGLGLAPIIMQLILF